MSKEKKVFFAFAASQQKLYRLLNGITTPLAEGAKTAAKQKLTLHIHAG